MAKKKVNAPAEVQESAETQVVSQSVAPEEVPAATETEPASAAAEPAVEAAGGADLADTVLGEVEGTLVVVNAPNGLRLRQGPGKQYPVIEVLEDGTLAAKLDLPLAVEVPGWALVFVSQERIGWVACSYIQEVKE